MSPDRHSNRGWFGHAWRGQDREIQVWVLFLMSMMLYFVNGNIPLYYSLYLNLSHHYPHHHHHVSFWAAQSFSSTNTCSLFHSKFNQWKRYISQPALFVTVIIKNALNISWIALFITWIVKNEKKKFSLMKNWACMSI